MTDAQHTLYPGPEFCNFVRRPNLQQVAWPVVPNLKKAIVLLMDKEPVYQKEQPNNPLHGMKLATILELLVEQYGWERLARNININCFKNDPSIKSSLTFLRKTQWARDKVEQLYLDLEKKKKPASTKPKLH